MKTYKAPFKGKTNYLTNLCISITDCHHSTPIYLDEGKLVIRNFNIKNGRMILDRPSFTDEKNFRMRTLRAKPEEGDLIITREAPMGEVCIIPEGVECCLGQRMVLIKPNYQEIDNKYLLYSLLSEYVQCQINKSERTGSIVSNLRIPILEKLSIPLVERNIQKVIGNILWKIDAKIELNNKINAELEAMAKLIYDYWFVQFDFPDKNGKPYKSSGGKMVWNEELKREIPEGWKNANITELTNLMGGGTPQTNVDSFWNGLIPFFTPADANGSIYAINTKDCITEEGLNNCSSKLFPEGTVFITARGTVGKINIASTDMAMNQSCYALQGKDGIDFPYIYYFTHELLQYIKSKASGSIFKALVTNDFLFTELPVPPIILIDKFSKLITPNFAKILNNQIENKKLAELRDWLLPMLMNGQVSVGETHGKKVQMDKVAQARGSYGE